MAVERMIAGRGEFKRRNGIPERVRFRVAVLVFYFDGFAGTKKRRPECFRHTEREINVDQYRKKKNCNNCKPLFHSYLCCSGEVGVPFCAGAAFSVGAS